MKIHLVVLLAFCTLSSLFAAVQYGADLEKGGLSVIGSSQKGWSLTVLENSVLSFNTNRDLLARVNGHMSTIMQNYGTTFLPSYTNVGYFTYDATTRQLLTSETLQFKDDVARTRELTSGEKVGFWMEKDGVKYASVKVNGGDFKTDSSMKVFGGGDTGKDGTRVYNYGTVLENKIIQSYELSMLVGVERTGGPSGQPLPGIIATMLLGGAGLAGLKFRKGKKRNC